MAVNILGVDIGSYAAKVVSLNKIKNGKANLLALGMVQLPIDVVLDWENDHLVTSKIISEALKKMVNIFKLSSKYVSTSISGDSIVMKKITVPAMNDIELKGSIESEAEQYIPFAINEVNISYHVLSTLVDTGDMSILLVAARKTIVQNYMETLALAKLKPAVIDIDGLALCNAYEFTNPDHQDNVIMVDIGANLINIIILNKGVPLVFKDELGGGHYLNAELAELLKLGYEDVEKIKFGSEPGPKPKESAILMDRVVSNWISCVERTLDIARAEVPNYKATRILLSGGCSLICGLANEFQKYFNITTELFNPLLSIQFNPKKYDPKYIEYIGPQMAVSFGLALRKVEVE